MKDLGPVKQIEKASLEETNFNYSYEDQNKYFFIES